VDNPAADRPCSDEPTPDPAGYDRDPVTLRYGPNRLIALSLVVGAVLFIGTAIGTGDRSGRLIYLAAGLLLAVVAASDLIFRVRLVVSSAGISVHAPTTRLRIDWADIDIVRVDERSRLGLSARTLEIDAGEQLVLLSQRSLGQDARTVAAEIDAFRISR
jgi:hypothetical protein